MLEWLKRRKGNSAGGDPHTSKQLSDERLVIMPMPALVAVLLNKEREKGSPLTEAEVIAVRDTAACIMAPHDVVTRIAEERGYDDIDPERAWDDWNAIRPSLRL